MPRPHVPLDEHKDFIVDCISLVGLTQQEVCDELLQMHDLKVGRSTLVKTLAKWGVRTRRPNFNDTPALRTRLHHFFHQTRLTDAEIAASLTRDEGIDITPVRVRKLRRKMGLYKRVDPDKKEATEKSVEEVLKAELEENEDVRKLGQKALYSYLRKKHGFTGRDRIFVIAKRLDPEGPERRTRAQRKQARRSGLAKERQAKEELLRQEQLGITAGTTTAGTTTTAGATTTEQSEQHPLPAQYLPLDPAMYMSASTQQHVNTGQQANPGQHAQHEGDNYAFADTAQAIYPAYSNGRHVATAGPDIHPHAHYPAYPHQGDTTYNANPY